MKFLLMLVVFGAFSACGLKEEDAQHKFAIRKKTSSVIVYHYAKYRFAHEGYDDVDVAVKVVVQSGQAKTLWVKDLMVTTNPLEEATLTASGANNINFSGTSSSDLGGTYTGVLETGERGEITGCCGEMTFVPTAANTLTFVGTKLEDLTAAQWEELNTMPTLPALMVAELGTQQVGELFGITGADSVQRLEAHNSEGKVEDALGRWQTEVGDDIFAVNGMDNLFLTDVAMTAGVTELIGFDANDNKVMKANLTVAERNNTIVLTASRFTRGRYTWVAFSANPNPDPSNSYSMQDVDKNVYLSFNADMEVHAQYTGAINYEGYDGRGFWVGINTFECLVGNKVMARVLNTIYMGSCLAEGD